MMETSTMLNSRKLSSTATKRRRNRDFIRCPIFNTLRGGLERDCDSINEDSHNSYFWQTNCCIFIWHAPLSASIAPSTRLQQPPFSLCKLLYTFRDTLVANEPLAVTELLNVN